MYLPVIPPPQLYHPALPPKYNAANDGKYNYNTIFSYICTNVFL